MTSADGPANADVLAENAGKICAILVCGFLAVLTMAAIAEMLGAGRRVIDMTIIAIGFAVAALLSWSARSAEPAVVAGGGQLPAPINAMAGLAAWVPGATLLSLAATHMSLGFDGLAFVLGPIAGLALSMVLFAPYLARSGALTVSEFTGLRFGPLPRFLAAITVVISSLMVAAAGVSALALLMSQVYGVPAETAIMGATAAALALSLPGGVASTSWSGLALATLSILAILVTAFMVTFALEGAALPQLAYGKALSDITALERTMIEQGLASAQTMKPHVKPFLQIDALNFQALILSLAAGTAAMAQHASRSFAAAGVREARSSAAGMLVLALLVAITMPLYGAFAKKEVYRLVGARTPLASLPASWEGLSRNDQVRIHGVSLGLFEAVARASEGAADAAAVGASLEQTAPGLAARWNKLKAPARALVLDSAKAAALRPAADRNSWKHYREDLLAPLAAMSGNKQALLTLPSLELDPSAAILSLPAWAGLPHIVSSLFTAGLIAAALAMISAALTAAATALAYDALGALSGKARGGPAGTIALRIGLIASAALAAAAARFAPDVASLLPAALSIAAAGLFPALLLGIWWKRANAWGATLAMVLGLAVAVYYAAGVMMFPVAFGEMWAAYSDATPAAIKKLGDLTAAWQGAAEGEAKTLAFAALEAHARGTAFDPGPASWLGVSPLAAAIFAMPAGVVVLLAVSLLSPAPGAEQQAFLAKLRRPARAEATEPFGR